jgi:hypothetical protein
MLQLTRGREQVTSPLFCTDPVVSARKLETEKGQLSCTPCMGVSLVVGGCGMTGKSECAGG